MQELYNLELDDNDIKNMLEICPELRNLNLLEISNNIEILRRIDCSNLNIKNILLSNPYFLCRNHNDIIQLIGKLSELNISPLNLLFDSYPFLLNKDSYEIENYIIQETKTGKSIEDIIDNLETNPSIIEKGE